MIIDLVDVIYVGNGRVRVWVWGWWDYVSGVEWGGYIPFCSGFMVERGKRGDLGVG